MVRRFWHFWLKIKKQQIIDGSRQIYYGCLPKNRLFQYSQRIRYPIWVKKSKRLKF